MIDLFHDQHVHLVGALVGFQEIVADPPLPGRLGIVGVGDVLFRVDLLAVVGAFHEAVHVITRPAVDPVMRVFDRRRLESLDNEAVTERRELFFQFFLRKAPGLRARAGQQAAECQDADVGTTGHQFVSRCEMFRRSRGPEE